MQLTKTNINPFLFFNSKNLDLESYILNIGGEKKKDFIVY